MERAQQELQGALNLLIAGYLHQTQDTADSRKHIVRFVQETVQRWEEGSQSKQRA